MNPPKNAEKDDDQRHLCAKTDQPGTNQIVHGGNNQAPDTNKNGPTVVAVTKKPLGRTTPDDDQ
jgi:hypothetical protein